MPNHFCVLRMPKMRIGSLSFFRPTWVMAAVVLIFSCVLVEILYRTNALQRAENLYTDFWHQQIGKRFSPEHASLVLIDEYSLNQLADTPLTFWTPYIAKVVEGLRDNGAKVIGLDLLFSSSAEQWLRRFKDLPESAQNYDQALREQINKDKVVLVTPTQMLSNGYMGFVLPIPDMVFSLPDFEKPERFPADRYPQLADFDFRIGIGVNSGTAIMGNIGSSKKREYTALGDTVNIASRLETVTKQLGWTIVASDATVKQAGNQAITGGHDQITVKGRQEAIIVHEIVGLRETA